MISSFGIFLWATLTWGIGAFFLLGKRPEGLSQKSKKDISKGALKEKKAG